MFRCRLVCAYVEVNIVYHCFTQVRHVLTGFMYVFGLVWLFVLFFHSLYVCVSSDPQSSRARKLCVTMEPALLLKGDIMVRNNLITVWHLLRFFFYIYMQYITAMTKIPQLFLFPKFCSQTLRFPPSKLFFLS